MYAQTAILSPKLKILDATTKMQGIELIARVSFWYSLCCALEYAIFH